MELRETVPGDPPSLLRFRLAPEADRMAAFTVADPSDRAAFDARRQRLLGDPEIVSRTVLLGGEDAGYAAARGETVEDYVLVLR